MSNLKNLLRVRNLNNTKLQVPINKGFEDFWLAGLLPVEFLENDQVQANGFSLDGLHYDGTLYRYQLAKEMPRIFQENARSKQHPVLKSLSDKESSIVDLTLGEGRDSLTFLNAGRKVIAFERNPFIFIYFLINLSRLHEVTPLPLENLEVVFGNFFNENGASIPMGLNMRQFYYDPMFQPSKRKALPRGTIQLFEKLVVEGDEDQKENLKWLLENFDGKVVVKRSPNAGPILAKFNHQLKTKLVRYDVYV
jgi:hypothetical protein